MIIALVGGSGRIGKRIAGYAIEKRHRVKSFNRHPDRVKTHGVETVEGDVADLKTLTEFFKDADVIVYAVTVYKGDMDSYPEGIKNALRAAKDAGVKRIVIPNSYCTLNINGEEIKALFAAPPPFFAVIPRFKEGLELIRQEEELDWLVISGPAFTPPYHDVTGEYIVAEGDEMIIPEPEIGPGSSRISMEDYANFILTQVESPDYHRTRITVCNPYSIWAKEEKEEAETVCE